MPRLCLYLFNKYLFVLALCWTLILLNPLHLLTCLFLSATLWERFCYYHHFTKEESKTLRNLVIFPKSPSQEEEKLAFEPRQSNIRSVLSSQCDFLYNTFLFQGMNKPYLFIHGSVSYSVVLRLLEVSKTLLAYLWGQN